MPDLNDPTILQTLPTRAPVGIAIVKPDGTFADANPAYCVFTGYTLTELRRRRWQDITHPDDLKADEAEALDLANDPRRDSYVIVKRYLRKDGHSVWCELSVSPLRTPDNLFCGYLTFAVPVPDTPNGYRVDTQGDRLELRSTVRWIDLVRDNPRETAILAMIILAVARGESAVELLGKLGALLMK